MKKRTVNLFKKPHQMALASMIAGGKSRKKKSAKHRSQEVAAKEKKIRKRERKNSNK